MTYLTDIERLNYYEGEFLGAVDFQAEQEYHRDMRRRHNLGPHTWGIVTGLDLAQAPNGNMDGTLTEVDVYLQPGMAVDGFGREIVVLNQYQLTPSMFAAVAPQGPGVVQTMQIWIGFQQALLQPPTDTCSTTNVSNAFARIQETYTLTVTAQGVTPNNGQIVVNGSPTTPPVQPSSSSGSSSGSSTPTDPPPITLPYDDSIPFQEFSTDDTSLTWWLPLGQVSWDASNGVFVQISTPSAGREYAGNVSAETYAPAGAYLIADRNSPYPAPASSNDPNLGGVQAEVAGSLTVDFLLNAELTALIGAPYNSNTQVTRPLTIVASGKNQDLLELRNSGGTPIWYVNEQFDGTTLGFNLGEVGPNGNVDNRIFVQPTLTKTAPSQQNVGIGTSTPRNPLAIRGQGSWWELLSFEDNKGNTKWHMNHNPQGSAPNGVPYTPGLNFCETGQSDFRLFLQSLQSGGNVGIGTGAPVAALDVASGVVHVGGATNPSITGQGAYLGWNALTGGTGETDFINQQGSGKGAFAFMNVTTSGGALNTLMFINGSGEVGIGTTGPDRPLAIQAQGSGQELISFKNLAGTTKWHMNQNLSGTANGLNFAETGVADGRLFLRAGGNVGIGTTSPLAPLHVASPSGLSNSALPNVLIESPSGLGPSPRLGLVDTSLGSNTSAPVWFIDNNGDSFRILRQPNYSTGGTAFLEIDNSGNVTITKGGLNISNGPLYSSFKSGCVQDRFVNRDGLDLQRGDVVVLHSTPAAHYFGPDSRIPLIEVQLTDVAMDTRVCGIVDEPSLPDKELGDLDRTKLGNAKVGRMVTLGAYSFCKVDADISPISPGDLLTTSPTRGYAQKLERHVKPGGIIGKALGCLEGGKGLIPVLVSHQ